MAFGTSRYSKKKEGGKSLGHGHATIYVGAGMLIYASDYGVKLGRVKNVQGNRLMGVRNAN